MELIRSQDIDKINKNIKDILNETDIYIKNNLDPKIIDFRTINTLIFNYIEEKNRIIYGGYAIDAYIKNKNNNDKIYKEYDYRDIEIYSYEPIVDIKNICDILHKRGYKNIVGK
jgi:hypothetical protein